MLGLTAYRAAFDRPHATVGEQSERVGGATVWLVPNPSGLQAHYQLDAVVAELEALRLAVRAGGGAASGRGGTAGPA